LSSAPHDDFEQLVERYRKEIKVHCYRMLGSSHDCDDAVQETWLRAWRARDGLRDAALIRPWLYRIATNVCLDELKRRPRRILPTELFAAAADPMAPIRTPVDEPIWLEPMPGSWLEASAETDPLTRYSLKESVRLAFIAVLQHLTAAQRAVLLLRDVVGLSAHETAAALTLSVPAANSALFRARKAIGTKLGPSSGAAHDVNEEVLGRYLRAWEADDVDGLVALLHNDVRTTMPPSPTWIAGHFANAAFYSAMIAAQGPRTFRMERTQANDQPAFAVYRKGSAGESYVLRAIQVLGLNGAKIVNIDHFMQTDVLTTFDLPLALRRD